MPNPNPKTDQLAMGRGKRPKLNNQTVGMRMSQFTRQRLEQIAQSYGCEYGGKPWIAGLLEKIASGDLLVVPVPPLLPRSEVASVVAPKQAIRERLKKKHYVSDQPGDGHSLEEHEEDSSDAGLSRDTY